MVIFWAWRAWSWDFFSGLGEEIVEGRIRTEIGVWDEL
jgi:hypothetical protein